jgi:hypothetical protein
MNFEVAKDELATTRVVPAPVTALAPDRARLRVETFALTTNNVTYAVFGAAMQYWDFFPTDDPDGWGRVPVWGFAEAVESTSAACAVGERLYGYLPMASELVIEPGRADERGLTDVTAHRAPMASAYNRYTRCAADPGYDATRETQQMLLSPLFFTSFVVDDFFADRGDLGTDTMILSSASSKTAIGIAFEAHRRGRRVVGLTSARHRDFVVALGVYDEVVLYGDVSPEAGTAVFVDMAGNADVRHAVHAAYGDRLAHSMVVGGTHWDHSADEASGALPGPRPEFFFAPTQIAKRSADWGRAELDRRIAAAWTAYSTWTDGWLVARRAVGPDAVGAAWVELLAGGTDPSTGYACALPAGS